MLNIFLPIIRGIAIASVIRNTLSIASDKPVILRRTVPLDDFNYFTACCRSFDEFLTYTNYIVDKSEFIEEIWRAEEDILIISTPPVFGKTTNLGMLSLFFEIQTNDDGGIAEKERNTGYRYFKYGRYTHPEAGEHVFSGVPAIGEHVEFLEEHQGKYPVIYLDFKETYPSKAEDVLKIVSMKIANEFRRHMYVQKHYFEVVADAKSNDEDKRRAKEEWRRFELLGLNREHDYVAISRSLRFLCEVLWKYFNQKVIVLVDDMDCLVNHVKERWIYEDEPRPVALQSEVMKFLGRLMADTMSDNEYLRKAVIMAETLTCVDELFEGVGSLRVYDSCNNRFSKFFGFTKQVTEMLCDMYNVSDALVSKATQYYHGYRFDCKSKEMLSSPWNIMQLVEKKTLKRYWITCKDEKIRKLMALEKMEPVMEMISGGDMVEVMWNKVRFSDADLDRLSSLVRERIVRPTVNDTGLVLRRLCAAGYLTCGLYNVVSGRYSVAAPNEEVRGEFENFRHVVSHEHPYGV